VTQYEFASEAIDFADGWLEVWTVGEARGRDLHLRSWPAFASVLKANEYCSGLGRFKRLRTISDVQEELQRRYELIQQQVWALLPSDLPRAVKLAPLPAGTVFSKETVRADHIVMFGVREVPAPLGVEESRARARGLCAYDGAQLTSTSVLGRPAVVAATTEHDDVGGFVAAVRSLVIAPTDHPVCVDLILRSEHEAAAGIDAVLADILSRAELVTPGRAAPGVDE
jgi:hypothetical protein